MSNIKGSRAGLAVAVAGMGIGIAMLVDAILAEKRFKEASNKQLLIENLLPKRNEENNLKSDLPNLESISENLHVDEQNDEENDNNKQNDNYQHINEFEDEQDDEEDDEEENKLYKQVNEILPKKPKSTKIYDEDDENLSKVLRDFEEEDYKNRIVYTDLKKMLPGESYADFFVRARKLEEDRKYLESIDDSYKGDGSEPSRKIYLTKKAYVDARKSVN